MEGSPNQNVVPMSGAKRIDFTTAMIDATLAECNPVSDQEVIEESVTRTLDEAEEWGDITHEQREHIEANWVEQYRSKRPGEIGGVLARPSFITPESDPPPEAA